MPRDWHKDHAPLPPPRYDHQLVTTPLWDRVESNDQGHGKTAKQTVRSAKKAVTKHLR